MNKDNERNQSHADSIPLFPWESDKPLHACNRCEERGKTWSGSDPKCAFVKGKFSSDNWNCATMNALRDLPEEDARNEASHACIIPGQDCLWVILTWYKHRGQTEQAWMIYPGSIPKLLTLKEAETILANPNT